MNGKRSTDATPTYIMVEDLELRVKLENSFSPALKSNGPSYS